MKRLSPICGLLVILPLLGGCTSSGSKASPGAAISAGLSASQAHQVFEKFKALEGDWNTRSTKGWGGQISYKVINGGACVMELDDVAHPGEMMVTMIHPDGARLMLTHYCAAKNQPRLVATRANDDLSVVTFTFLDATNLASRDKGHMDKVVFRFLNNDEFTDRWTWYQDGKESWMEDIANIRVKN